MGFLYRNFSINEVENWEMTEFSVHSQFSDNWINFRYFRKRRAQNSIRIRIDLRLNFLGSFSSSCYVLKYWVPVYTNRYQFVRVRYISAYHFKISIWKYYLVFTYFFKKYRPYWSKYRAYHSKHPSRIF